MGAKKGGYSCAMKNCTNISGRKSGLSFFGFPKDPDRAKLWLEKCERKINVSPENLHKNYKVCGDHFKLSMFLNNLKNRLQPHAIPVLTGKNNTNGNELNIKMSESEEIHHKFDGENNTLISGECDIIQSNCDEQQQIEAEFSEVECHSVSVNNNLWIINGHCKQLEPVHVQHQYSQTNIQLSDRSPRKEMLRAKISALQRTVRNLKQQLARRKNNIKTSNKMSWKEYYDATDEFLPPEIAAFVKTQVRLNKCKSAKGRKYSLSFKKFCLDLLFSEGGKTYNSFAQQFILPNIRTLQRMIQN